MFTIQGVFLGEFVLNFACKEFRLTQYYSSSTFRKAVLPVLAKASLLHQMAFSCS